MTNELSQSARAAFRVGFGRATNVLVFALIVGTAIVLGFMVLGFILKAPVVAVTTERWRCQVAQDARVALCRIPDDFTSR